MYASWFGDIACYGECLWFCLGLSVLCVDCLVGVVVWLMRFALVWFVVDWCTVLVCLVWEVGVVSAFFYAAWLGLYC